MSTEDGANVEALSDTEDNPSRGFIVEVSQPYLLDKMVTNFFKDRKDSGESPHSKTFEISNERFGDKIIRNENTLLHAYLSDQTVTFRSYIVFSEQRQSKLDRGNYDLEKLTTIAGLLEHQGAAASVYTSEYEPDKPVIMITGEGYQLRVDFMNLSDGENGPAYSPQLHISLGKVKNNELDMFSSRIILGDQDGLEPALRFYTKAYSQLLNALYAEQGITPPDRTITMRPPILNADSLTQFDSIQRKKPFILTEAQVSPEKISFADIAGQETAVETVRRLVVGIRDPEIYARRGVELPKGILFYGPPGTGKTMLARAFIDEAGDVAEGFFVSVSDIRDKWYGNSEKRMQEVFDRANKLVDQGKKVIIVFDEIDALGQDRDSADEATQSIISVMLQNMDGVSARNGVTIIGATNRPDVIDPALMRSGRFSKKVEVGLPSSEGRKAILDVHIKKAIQRATEPDGLFDERLDMDRLAQATEGMSGADLKYIINLALEEKLFQEIQGVPWSPVTTDELLKFVQVRFETNERERQIGFKVR